MKGPWRLRISVNAPSVFRLFKALSDYTSGNLDRAKEERRETVTVAKLDSPLSSCIVETGELVKRFLAIQLQLPLHRYLPTSCRGCR